MAIVRNDFLGQMYRGCQSKLFVDVYCVYNIYYIPITIESAKKNSLFVR